MAVFPVLPVKAEGPEVPVYLPVLRTELSLTVLRFAGMGLVFIFKEKTAGVIGAGFFILPKGERYMTLPLGTTLLLSLRR